MDEDNSTPNPRRVTAQRCPRPQALGTFSAELKAAHFWQTLTFAGTKATCTARPNVTKSSILAHAACVLSASSGLCRKPDVGTELSALLCRADAPGGGGGRDAGTRRQSPMTQFRLAFGFAAFWSS